MVEVKIVRIKIINLAEEIDIKKAESCIKESSKDIPFSQSKLLYPKYINYTQAPLLVKNKTEIELNGKLKNTLIDTKIFELGVVSAKIIIDFSGSLEDARKKIIEIESTGKIDAILEQKVNEIAKKIDPALKSKENEITFFETYTIVFLKNDGKINCTDFVEKNRQEISRILKSEKRKLSKQTIEKTTKRMLSYYDTDLVIVDENSSFIIDTEIPFDTINVLEYSLVQLLEMRTYDKILDKKLDELYSEIEKTDSKKNYSKTLDELSKFTLWIQEITDKIDNTMKLVGDNYFAQLYSFAVDEFHLKEWDESLKSKNRELELIYQKLNNKVLEKHNQIYEITLVLLELIIVILIVIEVIPILFP